jgi:hypothetical protein
VSNLNGFNFGPGTTPYAIGIVWHTVTGYDKSLETVEMAIKGTLFYGRNFENLLNLSS